MRRPPAPTGPGEAPGAVDTARTAGHPEVCFHHVAVQTADLAGSLAWYEDLFGCRPSWTLDRFSPVTLARLPGIRRLTEVAIGDVRLHLFERAGRPADGTSAVAFQHVCLAVDSPEALRAWRRRWMELFASGRHTFALRRPATEIEVADDGVQTFYAHDVNGLELEFAYVPGGSR